MAVGASVLPAGDVDPEVLIVGGFEDELVEVGVGFEPVEPATGGLHIGMALVIIPGGVGGEWQTDVGFIRYKF